MSEKKQYKVGFFDDPTDVDDYVECDGKYLTSSDVVVLLNEQEETIQRLKAQLECGEDVCRICKHTYLVPSKEYYIAQCKKEHSGCSKGTVDYCDDFELKDSDTE